jgi:integrase
LRHKYTEKKVKAYSVEEIRALNAASTDEELQIWQFFLGTGFREEEVSHACDTDVDFRQKSISVLEKYTEKILYRPHVTLKARFKARIVW